MYQRGWDYQFGGGGGSSRDGGGGSAADGVKDKFLNSGCIVGRAGQLRHMLSYAFRHGSTLRDDQQMLVNYMQIYPDMVAIDHAHDLFITGYKLRYLEHNLMLMPDFTLYLRDTNAEGNNPNTPVMQIPQKIKTEEGVYDYYSDYDDLSEQQPPQPQKSQQQKEGASPARPPQSIGLLHHNNMKSSHLYLHLVSLLEEVQRRYYRGPDGPLLLNAVWAIRDGLFLQAQALLNSPLVLRNTSEYGGHNILRDFLLHQLAMKQALR